MAVVQRFDIGRQEVEISMFEIEKFFPDNRELDAQAIRDAGFYSKPLPDLPGMEELRDVALLLGEKSFQLWSYEYGQPLKFHGDGDIDRQTSELSSAIYKNILVSFGGDDFFFWLPEDHEYFVIFGGKPKVDMVIDRFFDYDFEEYMRDESENNKKYEILSAVKDRYDIS